LPYLKADIHRSRRRKRRIGMAYVIAGAGEVPPRARRRDADGVG
jgi:hypothetical protein